MKNRRRESAETIELEQLDAEQDAALGALDELDRRITLALAEWKREFVLVFPAAPSQTASEEKSPALQEQQAPSEAPIRAA